MGRRLWWIRQQTITVLRRRIIYNVRDSLHLLWSEDSEHLWNYNTYFKYRIFFTVLRITNPAVQKLKRIRIFVVVWINSDMINIKCQQVLFNFHNHFLKISKKKLGDLNFFLLFQRYWSSRWFIVIRGELLYYAPASNNSRYSYRRIFSGNGLR